ncbi:hypothetical protein GLYMA_14G055850v4 [Glycine max]|nr:hypothetical protein GLYMA_14G055850v4 [Glycine max]KAH1093207.1 hypothetical protein GYH30_039104 [Glycine max]
MQILLCFSIWFQLSRPWSFHPLKCNVNMKVDKKWLVPKRQRKNTKVPGLKVQL